MGKVNEYQGNEISQKHSNYAELNTIETSTYAALSGQGSQPSSSTYEVYEA